MPARLLLPKVLITHVSKLTIHAAQDAHIQVKSTEYIKIVKFLSFFLYNDDLKSRIVKDAEAMLRVFVGKFYNKNNLRSINFCLDNVLYEI